CHMTTVAFSVRFACQRQRPSTWESGSTSNKRSSSPVRSRDRKRLGQKNAARVCKSPGERKRDGIKGFELKSDCNRVNKVPARLSLGDIAEDCFFLLVVWIETPYLKAITTSTVSRCAFGLCSTSTFARVLVRDRCIIART